MLLEKAKITLYQQDMLLERQKSTPLQQDLHKSHPNSSMLIKAQCPEPPRQQDNAQFLNIQYVEIFLTIH